MGGNALKVETSSMQAHEFHPLADLFDNMLTEDGIKHFVCRSYKQKQVFNDLDVLLMEDGRDWREYILSRFSAQEVVNTVRRDEYQVMYSFDFDGRQIDFIIFQPLYFECAMFFYSVGMMGELVGRVAHGLGLKFGFYGLEYRHQLNKQHLGTIHLTRDPMRVLDVFGMDRETHSKGIEKLTDMFDYILSSPLFNARYCDLSTMNNDKRSKVKRRKEYMAFIDYLVENKVADKPSLSQEDRYAWIVANFPEANLMEKIDTLNKGVETASQVKDKLSAKHLMEAFGWEGVKLRVLRDYQATFANLQSYQDYVLATPVEQLLVEVKAFSEK